MKPLVSRSDDGRVLVITPGYFALQEFGRWVPISASSRPITGEDLGRYFTIVEGDEAVALANEARIALGL